MTSNNTTFVNNETVIMADWLNDVNNTVYNVLGDGYFAPLDAAGVRTNLQVPKNDGTGASGTWNISITGNSNGINGVLGVAQGGTGATTTTAAINALLPSQSAQSGKYLTTNGTTCSWGTISVPTSVPPGAVFHFAMTTPPSGYLECNGAAVSRTTYATLFAAIGTTFGAGDGSTTFNLPDLRGQFIRGYDDGAGIDPSRVFGSNQADTVGPLTLTDPGHTHTYGTAGSKGGSTGADPNQVWFAGTATTTTGSSTTGITLTGTSTETRPKNVALLPCIKT